MTLFPVTPFRPPDANEAAEMLPDGLVVAEGPDGVITTMNSRAEQVTGLRAEEVIGRHLRDALAFRDHDGQWWWDLASPWQGIATRTGHREKLLILPNGHEVLLTSRYLRRDRRGPVIAVLLSLRDAEARRRAEASHSALISTVAHELRSPLTGVKGFSSTLLRRWDRFSDDQKRLMLETIEADADRVTRLISELLDVSRIDSGRLRIHVQQVEVRPVLDRHVERLTASGVPRDRLTVEVLPGAERVWADPDRLNQILANLVENAVRHGEHAVRVRVAPAARPDEEGVVLTVDDDGPGIPENQREVVFSRFWHGHAQGSTGLGLYVVRALVRAHTGRVSVAESDLGGASIQVHLPLPPGE
ncbi:MAG TPA: ATP-binding protein [Dermatophilaceae bacterium]|nr:ATP-binding protein [Dermatophilaceae bacterium]